MRIQLQGGEPDAAAIASSLARPERFAAIFDRHYTAVHRYIARRVPRDQVEDLASLAFVVAFERRQSFRSTSTSALPWLLGIATNLVHERARQTRRDTDVVVLLVAARDPEGDGMASEPGLPQALHDALSSLDRSQLDVLLLYAWEELSYEEIADALGVPIGTVRSRLSRARERLRSRLEEPASVLPDPSKEIS